MCGRLCRWLRLFGFDSEEIGPEVGRAELPAAAARATAAGRVFVTRDGGLAERRGCGAVFLLAADGAEEQFREIAAHFGIRYCPRNPILVSLGFPRV